ncbi:core histone H2A/H2B/H3/H4 [Opisthorchis viverrini]|uniref:Histone H2A n=1 Tax=Opisthorchis viverrini TaxID=6198 RepID=A0A1S8WPF4_OPIVI|nr:core histone H2A/H2B/H3/H4 [Opisthorchis viverrini]
MTRSKAERSGLTFPVARIWRYMKRHYSFRRRRISITASVYLTAVMEYLTREVTELAGDLTIKAKRKLLTPRNIMLAIANDEELQKVQSLYEAIQCLFRDSALSYYHSVV